MKRKETNKERESTEIKARKLTMERESTKEKTSKLPREFQPKKSIHWVERGKDVAIVGLFCLAIFLASQVEAFAQLSTVLSENNQEIVVNQSVGLEQWDGFLPIGIMVVTQTEEVVEQYGVQYQQEQLEDLFDQTSTLLREAMGGLSAARSISLEDFLEYITTPPCVYFDLRGDVPLELIYGWLSGKGDLQNDDYANRLALAPLEGGIGLFYQEGDSFYGCTVTTVDFSRLESGLEHIGDNQAMFAFQREDLQGIHPLTLVLEQEVNPAVYTVSTPFLEAGGRTKLLEALEFPVAVHTQYATNDGVVIRIGTDSLRLADSGTITYTSEDTSRYSLSLGGEPTLFQLAEGCRQFAYQLLWGVEVVPQMNLVSVTMLEEGYQFAFDFSLDGIPIAYLDGLSGGEFWVVGEEIRSFTLQYREYIPTEMVSPVLPELQAQAVLEGLGRERGELFLVYQDTGGEQISTSWVTP